MRQALTADPNARSAGQYVCAGSCVPKVVRRLVVLLAITVAAAPALADIKESCLAPQQDVHAVLEACARLIAANPSKPELAAAHYNRGVSYLMLGLPYVAMSEFDEAIAADPNHYSPWAGRAEANARLRYFRLAQQDILKALSINPDRPDGQDLRALIAQELGDTDQLLSASEEEVRLNPNGADGYERRGEAYVRKGDLDKAKADFQRATTLNPGRASAWARLGTMSAMKGDASSAFLAFDTALAIDPSWIEALVNRGKLYEDKGELLRAASDYRASLSRSSDQGRARQLQTEALTRWVRITKSVPPAEPRHGVK